MEFKIGDKVMLYANSWIGNTFCGVFIVNHVTPKGSIRIGGRYHEHLFKPAGEVYRDYKARLYVIAYNEEEYQKICEENKRVNIVNKLSGWIERADNRKKITLEQAEKIVEILGLY